MYVHAPVSYHYVCEHVNIMCVCTHKFVFISAHVCAFVNNDSEHVYVCVSAYDRMYTDSCWPLLSN